MAEQFGYHTGDVLTDILAKNEAAKRQEMIDDINKKNIESEISARNEQADSARVQKEAAAALAKQRVQESQDRAAARVRFSDALKGISSATVPPANPLQGPPDMSDPNDPVRVSQQPTPLVDQFDPGTKHALALLQALGPDDPKADALLQTIVAGMNKKTGTGANRPGGYIWTSDRNGNPYNTGQFMEGVTGDQYHERPGPPQPNAANTPQLFYNREPDPNDKTGKTMREVPYMMTPDAFAKFLDTYKKTHDMNGNVHKGNLPNQKATPLYDQKTLIAFQNSLKSAGSLAEQLTKVNGFINTITDEDVKQDVGTIVNDPDLQGIPFEELVKANPATGHAILEGPPEHVARVRDVLRVVRPGLDKAQ